MLESYREGRDGWLVEQCPFPIFPEPGGLLPAGGDTNGGSIFWITDGPPGEWSLVLYDWRGGYVSREAPDVLGRFPRRLAFG